MFAKCVQQGRPGVDRKGPRLAVYYHFDLMHHGRLLWNATRGHISGCVGRYRSDNGDGTDGDSGLKNRAARGSDLNCRYRVLARHFFSFPDMDV